MATKDELDSFQRRCQAVVVWLTYKPDIIILEIANLRTKGVYTKELNIHFETDTLEEWKNDIELAIKTLDNKLNPNPGMGCIGCPYSPRCEHFDEMYRSEDIIKKYIAAKEVIRNLEPQIKGSRRYNRKPLLSTRPLYTWHRKNSQDTNQYQK